MTEDDFISLLDRRGADLSLWLAGEREAAAALLKRSTEARRQLRLAERAAILIAAPPPRTHRLGSAILAALPVPAGTVPRGFLASAGATLMASLAAGLVLGWFGLIADPLGTPADDLDQGVAIAFTADDNYGS